MDAGIPSPLQNLQQNLMRLARAHWRTLSQDDRQQWRIQEAQTLGISGYNLFVQHWFSQHHYGAVPIFGCAVFGWAFFAASEPTPSQPYFDLFRFNEQHFS